MTREQVIDELASIVCRATARGPHPENTPSFTMARVMVLDMIESDESRYWPMVTNGLVTFRQVVAIVRDWSNLAQYAQPCRAIEPDEPVAP